MCLYRVYDGCEPLLWHDIQVINHLPNSMAATLSTTYALCFVIVLLITRLVWKALKPLPAGCGAAPKYTSSLWWDILNLGHLLDLLQAAHSGTLHEVETSYARALSEIKGYKVRTYSYNRAGLSAITTSDVANVSAVLASQFSDFIVGGRQKAFAPLLGNPTMLAMDGEAWKHARSALRPIFARERVHDLYIMRKHNTGLLNTLLEARRDTVAAVDLQSMFVEHSLHISMELFGVGCIGDEYNAFHAALGESSAMLMKRSMTGKLYWLADSIAFRRACRTCLDLVDKQAKPVWLQSQRSSVPDEKPQDIGGKQTPLDELVASSKTYVELRHGILGLILASYETTAALMGWTFYFLARHPDSYAKLREQILKAFGSIAEPHQDITFQTLKSCTYLQYVMKEALRLEPPVPRSIKTAARDTTLPTGGGPDGTLPIFIPKVFSSILTLQLPY
jgi:cytochrome P450